MSIFIIFHSLNKGFSLKEGKRQERRWWSVQLFMCFCLPTPLFVSFCSSLHGHAFQFVPPVCAFLFIPPLSMGLCSSPHLCALHLFHIIELVASKTRIVSQCSPNLNSDLQAGIWFGSVIACFEIVLRQTDRPTNQPTDRPTQIPIPRWFVAEP